MRNRVLLALIAVCLLLATVFWSLREKQFYELPTKYKLVSVSSGQSSIDIARTLNRMGPSKDIGTSSNWLYEASGTVEDSRDELGRWLLHKYGLREVPDRSFVVFQDDKRMRTVVMFPLKDRKGKIDQAKHRVRINGRWREPGPVEELLKHFVH